ncbi:MAG: prepilin-type N-terminal cleavage/methylation domain-containing protein [Armatimonadota bacterium]|nr:prepilin-type N-terminal cleavage/methylation domain-containing protein [bacterium]
MKARGYTLVELLVVIAIIAILAAMIAPVLLQAKEAARMRVCASNMRQVGFAVNRYMDDNSGYGLPEPPSEYTNPWVLYVKPLLPNYLQAPPKSGGVPRYMTGQSPYHPPKYIWVCQGDTVKGSILEQVDAPFWYNFGSSYLYPGPSAYLPGKVGEFFKKLGERAHKPGDWRNQKRDILLADYWFDFHSGRRVPHQEMSLTPASWVSVQNTRSLNVLFLDLHMKTCTADERKEYEEYTCMWDNPHYVKQDTTD